MLTTPQIAFINQHFHENQGDTDLDFAIFQELKTGEELHYLAQHHNWNSSVKVLQWIAESPLCSQAIALELFWLAQPQDFQNTKLDQSLKDDFKNEIFTLIKTILKNYQNNFYQKSSITFDPKPFYENKYIVPEKLKQATIGEETYIYYKEEDVDDWFDADWQQNIGRADSAIELFNIAYFLDELEQADWILAHPLCDKGIASLVFWRLYTECAIYTNTPQKLREIEAKINSNLFPEVLAYDPKSDKNVKFNDEKIAWEIPEIMKKVV